jgi:hypothetical protein
MIRKLRIDIGIQLHEKYKENFDVSSELESPSELPVSSMYIWSKNFSHLVYEKSEVKERLFQSLSIVFVLPPPQALVASWEGHDLARACGIL